MLPSSGTTFLLHAKMLHWFGNVEPLTSMYWYSEPRQWAETERGQMWICVLCQRKKKEKKEYLCLHHHMETPFHYLVQRQSPAPLPSGAGPPEPGRGGREGGVIRSPHPSFPSPSEGLFPIRPHPRRRGELEVVLGPGLRSSPPFHFPPINTAPDPSPPPPASRNPFSRPATYQMYESGSC